MRYVAAVLLLLALTGCETVPRQVVRDVCDDNPDMFRHCDGRLIDA